MAMPPLAKIGDEIEKRSSGHLVRMCREPGEVVCIRRNRGERRSHEIYDGRDDENHAGNDGNLSGCIHFSPF